jgi:hypothetical protein
MLIGKVYRSQSGWSAWWLLWQNGAELARWPVTKSDARQVIASGADSTADYFAKRDRVYLDAGKSGLVAMEIQSINSVQDYVRAMSFLQTHASLNNVALSSANADAIALHVNLKSGITAFRGLMRSSTVLEPLGSVPAKPRNADSPNAVSSTVSDVQMIEKFALKK